MDGRRIFGTPSQDFRRFGWCGRQVGDRLPKPSELTCSAPRPCGIHFVGENPGHLMRLSLRFSPLFHRALLALAIALGPFQAPAQALIYFDGGTGCGTMRRPTGVAAPRP